MCPIRSQCCTNYNAPTGNLDSESSEEVLRLLRESGERYNQTIIMITHSREIAETASRIIRMRDGKIV